MDLRRPENANENTGVQSVIGGGGGSDTRRLTFNFGVLSSSFKQLHPNFKVKELAVKERRENHTLQQAVAGGGEQQAAEDGPHRLGLLEEVITTSIFFLFFAVFNFFLLFFEAIQPHRPMNRPQAANAAGKRRLAASWAPGSSHPTRWNQVAIRWTASSAQALLAFRYQAKAHTVDQ
ncbi:hypothetical protein TYRP_018190 [Tyrophagus putrescentiae]|nr:hypothetical protein TYRP_018190 [Tyrophagus putrescentiae]